LPSVRDYQNDIDTAAATQTLAQLVGTTADVTLAFGSGNLAKQQNIAVSCAAATNRDVCGKNLHHQRCCQGCCHRKHHSGLAATVFATLTVPGRPGALPEAENVWGQNDVSI
jgi:hypothetical protein